MSMLDSDAQSLPQGTFDIKAGPQTIMSQWVVTLDDGDEDEDDDDGQDADDDQVDVVDDVVSNNLNNNNNSVNYKNLNNTSNVNTGLLGNLNLVESVNAYTNGGAGTNYSEEEKWEDAVGTPHDLISSSSNNNRNISNKSPSIIHQQQHQQQMPSFSTANSISGLAANLGKSNSKLNSSLNAEEKRRRPTLKRTGPTSTRNKKNTGNETPSMLRRTRRPTGPRTTPDTGAKIKRTTQR
jgi:hypothetical protein